MKDEYDNVQDSGEERLTQRSREVFDDAVANLDGHTRSRLNQARQAALQAAQAPASVTHRWLLPAGSAAAVVLATVVTVHLWQQAHQPDTVTAVQVARATSVDDLEIVTADAELDLLKDMDFYAWLDTQDMTTTGEDG